MQFPEKGKIAAFHHSVTHRSLLPQERWMGIAGSMQVANPLHNIHAFGFSGCKNCLLSRKVNNQYVYRVAQTPSRLLGRQHSEPSLQPPPKLSSNLVVKTPAGRTHSNICSNSWIFGGGSMNSLRCTCSYLSFGKRVRSLLYNLHAHIELF